MISIDDILSEKPFFEDILSTSNLTTPDKDQFLSYFKQSYDQMRFSNNGPLVQKLEERLAKLHGTKYCVTMCSGFWAVALAAKYLALKGRSKVIMPSFTYRRMADIMAWLKLTPFFVDIDPNNLSVSCDTIKEHIDADTALILAAHPIVKLCDVEPIEKLAQEHNIPLLIDAVEASCSTLQGKPIGSFGDAECFSMHASKFFNGFEAGYITTSSKEMHDYLSHARGFGFYGHEEVRHFGVNAKLNELHAAAALCSLDAVEDQIEHNKKLYDLYKKGIEDVNGLNLLTYNEKPTERATFKNIIVELTKDWPLSREETIEVMHKDNLLVRPYYSPALHQKETVYECLQGDMTQTEYLTQRYLILPSGAFVQTADVLNIVQYLQQLSLHAEGVKDYLCRIKYEKKH